MRKMLRELVKGCMPSTHCPEEEPLATLCVNRCGEVVVRLTDEARRRYEANTGGPCPADQVLFYLHTEED